jgi:hypothetical protein
MLECASSTPGSTSIFTLTFKKGGGREMAGKPVPIAFECIRYNFFL